MKLQPRLVLSSNNFVFQEDSKMGLASILTELGLPRASEIIISILSTLKGNNLFSLMDTVRLTSDHGIATATLIFLYLLEANNYNTTISKLSETTIPFTSGYINMTQKIFALTKENYGELIEWLGYPEVDYYTFIQNPYSYLDWVILANPVYIRQYKYLKERNIAYFFREMYLRLGEEDLASYPSKWIEVKTWCSIVFDDHILGADPNYTQRYLNAEQVTV